MSTLLNIADRVAASTGPERELADEVLLAAGWRLNHDADDIAAWRIDAGFCEGEDGRHYPVTLADRMNWACWYSPRNRPFRDSWIDGHYRPNPLATLDAALELVPEDAFWRLGHDGDGADPSEFRAQLIVPKLGGRDAIGVAIASTPALALTAAALRTLAATQGDL